MKTSTAISLTAKCSGCCGTLEKPVNRQGRFSSITHRVNHQAGTTHQVAAGKNTGHTRHLIRIHHHRAPIIDRYSRQITIGGEWHGIETVGHEHYVSPDFKFRSFDWAGLP